MFGIINLPAFILAGVLLILTPGVDTMYILSRSIAQGKKAGVYSVLGIVTGTLCHTTFAAFGLSLIIARYTMVFDLIKYLGAIYLAYLGVKMLLSKPAIDSLPAIKQAKPRKIYISGFLTNILNPKTALFFLVFLPQFVTANEVHNPAPYLILGIMFIIPGTIWCLMLVAFASGLSHKIRENKKISLWLNRVTGGVFIGLGLKLALLAKK